MILGRNQERYRILLENSIISSAKQVKKIGFYERHPIIAKLFFTIDSYWMLKTKELQINRLITEVDIYNKLFGGEKL